jgi:hypothetical protein
LLNRRKIFHESKRKSNETRNYLFIREVLHKPTFFIEAITKWDTNQDPAVGTEKQETLNGHINKQKATV